MLERATCPDCGTEVEIDNYNDGNCPGCNLVYSWQPVGIENAECQDGPHDYVTWRVRRTDTPFPNPKS
jgi:hypothetical protein